MIGVAGEGPTADRIVDRLAAAEVTTARGTPDELAAEGPAGVVTVGEAALAALVDAGFEGPVLPVAVGLGVEAGDESAAPTAAERFAAGDVVTVHHPLLAVSAAGDRVGRALLDVLLVRSEPGRISEFGVSADDRLDRFRADGVVVATPAGSHGYAHAAGGPRLTGGTDTVVVVPVAPFGLGGDTWVVDPSEGIELVVERDDGAVSVLLDGREARTLSDRRSVELTLDGTFELVRPPAG